MMNDGSEYEMMMRIQRSALRPDAQPFMALKNLAPGSLSAKVWHRYIAGDFMASIKVRREGRFVDHRLTATGEGLAEALENLATVVAAPVAQDEEG